MITYLASVDNILKLNNSHYSVEGSCTMFKFLPDITTSIYDFNVSLCTKSYLWCNWNHELNNLPYRNKLVPLWFDFEGILMHILFPNIVLLLNNFLQALSRLKWRVVKYRQWLESKKREKNKVYLRRYCGIWNTQPLREFISRQLHVNQFQKMISF